MTEHVRFLTESGVEIEADMNTSVLAALRAGYPMRAWPDPWRELPTSGVPMTGREGN